VRYHRCFRHWTRRRQRRPSAGESKVGGHATAVNFVSTTEVRVCVRVLYTSINNTLTAQQYHPRDFIVITIIETCLLSRTLGLSLPISAHARVRPANQKHTLTRHLVWYLLYVVYCSRSSNPLYL